MKAVISMMAAALLAAASPVFAQSAVDGLWMNPHGTVAVRTGDCRGRLCGWVAWAAPQALQDARDSGVDDLIGTELLEDYVANGADRWSGSVYVPDMGHHFSSTITRVAADRLRVRGCLIGGFLCKSQVWQRIERVPNA